MDKEEERLLSLGFQMKEAPEIIYISEVKLYPIHNGYHISKGSFQYSTSQSSFLKRPNQNRRKEGYLSKKGLRPSSKWKRKFCRLRDDKLILTKNKIDLLSVSFIDLKDSKIVPFQENGTSCFAVINSSGTWWFSCESKEVRDEWVIECKRHSTFKDNIKNSVVKQGSLEKLGPKILIVSQWKETFCMVKDGALYYKSKK